MINPSPMAFRAAVLGTACLQVLAACMGGEIDASASGPKGGGDPAKQTAQAPTPPDGALDLTVQTIAEGLVNPWSIAFLPDGDILVTERAGRLRVVRNGSLIEAAVEGVPQVLAWNQGGLFDVLPHPEFAQNRLIYLSFAHGDRGANATRIVRAKFDGASLSDVEPIYDAYPTKDTGHHFGGRMAWGGDGKLYLTIGEGSKYKERAQDMSTSFGAVVRLNEDGSVPDDNPSFGPGARPELYSKGHRNAQGMSYDDARGVLWTHEHGPRGGDEINIVVAGANYGWPIASYGIDYNGARITPFTEYEGTTQPFKYWTPSIAPSGLAVYRGDLFPSDWDGDLLVGALALTALHRVKLDDMRVVGEERYLVGNRIRDVRVGPDGAIYVTTEDRGGSPTGKLLRLTPASD